MVDRATSKMDWAQGFSRSGDWRAQKFPRWRSMFLFGQDNTFFSESLELAFRGAAILTIFSVPRIFNWDKGEDSFFDRNYFFDKFSIFFCVYILYGSVGITQSFALQGLSGTTLAALLSGVMYFIFPNGTSGEEGLSAPHLFGIVFGVSVVILVYLLNFSITFQQFFVSFFLGFWMTFMDETQDLRTETKLRDQVSVLGLFHIPDWGGGALAGILTMVIGAILAMTATLLPYPILSIDKAADSAAHLIGTLGETWHHAVKFYLDQEKDDVRRASLLRHMAMIKADLGIEHIHLDGGWWERFFLRRCFGNRHRLLCKLEDVALRSFERLKLVVDVCEREQFEEAHSELMRPDRCGEAVLELVGAANKLLRTAVDRAEDGYVSEDEVDELEEESEAVLEAEQKLTRKVWASLDEVMNEESQKHGKDKWEDIASSLAGEQVFLFSVCDFGKIVRSYADWLTFHGNQLPVRHYHVTYLKAVFDTEKIFDPERFNFTVRSVISVLTCWLIGYFGYHKMIRCRDSEIASAVSLLVTRNRVAPIAKGFGRVQGIVVGLWFGKMAFALLGYCDPFWQAVLTIVVFVYVFMTLFVYYYDSPYSFIGMLAAAFGTRGALEGCSEEYVEFGGPVSHSISDLLIGITFMTLVDLLFSLGRPSDKAYHFLMEAWTVSQEVLASLLMPGCDMPDSSKMRQMKKLMAEAERFAAQAAEEPRYSRPPFEKQLFADLISAAKILQTQIVCISQVAMEGDQVSDNGSEAGSIDTDAEPATRKAWFNEIVAKKNSNVDRNKDDLLVDVDLTAKMIQVLQGQNEGQKRSDSLKQLPRARRVASVRDMVRSPDSAASGQSGAFDLSQAIPADTAHFALSVSPTSKGHASSLVDDERAQKNFVLSCLNTIADVNYELQILIVKSCKVL